MLALLVQSLDARWVTVWRYLGKVAIPPLPTGTSPMHPPFWGELWAWNMEWQEDPPACESCLVNWGNGGGGGDLGGAGGGGSLPPEIPCLSVLMLYEYGVYIVYTPINQRPGQPPESYSVSQANLLGSDINRIQATIPVSGEYKVTVNFFRFECTECCKEETSITSHLHLSYSFPIYLERNSNGRTWIPVRLDHPRIKLECINETKC